MELVPGEVAEDDGLVDAVGLRLPLVVSAVVLWLGTGVGLGYVVSGVLLTVGEVAVELVEGEL